MHPANKRMNQTHTRNDNDLIFDSSFFDTHDLGVMEHISSEGKQNSGGALTNQQKSDNFLALISMHE